MRPLLLLCALLAALLAGLAATSVLIQPPAVRTVSKPGQFDAVRAKARLATILGNQQPHPADSFGDDAVRARLIGLDERLEEASADLYATPLRTFGRVTLPLAMPAVLAGFLLSFTLSLDNTIVSAFVQVSGTTPWPVYVLSSLRSGLRPEIAAVSTIMLVLTLASLALVALVLKRAGDSVTDIARTMAGG